MYASKTPVGDDGRLRNVLVYRHAAIFQKTKSMQQLIKTLRTLPNEPSVLTKNIECVACQGAEQDLILGVSFFTSGIDKTKLYLSRPVFFLNYIFWVTQRKKQYKQQLKVQKY